MNAHALMALERRLAARWRALLLALTRWHGRRTHVLLLVP